MYLGTLLYLAAACLWFALRLLLTRRAVAGQCLAAALALCALLCALYPVSPLNHYVQDVYVPRAWLIWAVTVSWSAFRVSR